MNLFTDGGGTTSYDFVVSLKNLWYLIFRYILKITVIYARRSATKTTLASKIFLLAKTYILG